MAEHVKRLRDCVMAGKKVDMDEMNVIMDGTTVPRSALTNMLMFQYASPFALCSMCSMNGRLPSPPCPCLQMRSPLTRFLRSDSKAEKKFYTIEAVWNALKCQDYRTRA